MTYFRDLPPDVQEQWRAAHDSNTHHDPGPAFPWESPFDSGEQRIERLKAAYVEGRIDLETFESRLDAMLGLAA